MKKGKVFKIILAVIIILAVLFSFSINFFINFQWFKELGYLSVFFTKITAVLKLFIPVFIVTFSIIAIYYKALKPSINNIRKVVDVSEIKSNKLGKKFILVDSIISLVFTAAFSTTYWYKILEFTNSTNFNVKDPIFNKDISFFVFKLPLIKSLYGGFLGLLTMLIIITIMFFIIISAKERVITLNKNGFSGIKNIGGNFAKFAGRQMAVILALIMIMVGFGYAIKAWDLVYSTKGVVHGAGYTEANVTLKFYMVIIVASLICAVVSFVSVMLKKVKPVVLSIALIVLLVIVKGVAVICSDQFIVQSNEKTVEKPYIENNINYTKKAYNIENIKSQDFQIKNDLTTKDLEENKDTIQNIKVNSYKPALEFYNQFQYIRYYYNFNDVDIDRYKINGNYNQVFIAPREVALEKLDENSTTWQNRHLAYTHGYGVVMSKVNSVTSEGQPDFVMSNVPVDNETDIKLNNPRIYFGEGKNNYSIVNTKLGEIDYPNGGENATNNYDGKAGIKMNLLNRILFAAKEQNINFLLSRDITSDSKVIIYNNILNRVKTIAPFLSYDSDPYIVVSNNQLYWIIDAYTSTDKYPYSQPSSDGVNYIRNSVKIVVDAYNGDTNFYIVDKNDPIAATYSKIFPNLFKDIDKVPEDIRSHFRYPEDIFKIQCNMLEKYHVNDAGVFYNGDDIWSVANDKETINEEEKRNETSFITMKLPGEQKEEMVILDYFNTKGRDNMVSMFGARMDGDNYGQLFLYKLPSGGTVYSPMLFKQKINQDPTISKELSLWNTEGSGVQFGDILIIPIKNSLLYVEPLYLRASGEKSIPEMKNVIIGYGDKLVMAENIDSALKQIFGDSGKQSDKTDSSNTTSQGLSNSQLSSIKEIYDKAIASQRNGDWAKYGEYINQLGEMINKLESVK